MREEVMGGVFSGACEQIYFAILGRITIFILFLLPLRKILAKEGLL